jgi:hypothetical protein
MLAKLAKIANRLDSLGLTKEADILDSYIQKVALDLPEVDLDSLPDSPEELAKYKAQNPEMMMASPSHSGSGIRGVAPVSAPASSVKKPSAPVVSPSVPSAGHSAAEMESEKERQEMYQAFLKGKGYRPPAEVKKQYNFNFDLTGGKTGTIAKIQAALTACGFPAGAADGFWGKNTDNAFLDALHAFLVLSPETAAMEKLSEVGANILNGEPATMPFTYDMVIYMCDYIKKARAAGETISFGRPLGKHYSGSMGGGRFEQRTPTGEAALVSTKAGEPVAGTVRK